MGVGTLEFRQLAHTNRHLRQARGRLAQQTIRGQPGRRGPLLHILPQTNIHRVVVLRDIPINIIQPPIAHLNVDLAMEQQLKKAYKRRYHRGARTALQESQQSKAYHPRSDMPMRRAATLILGLHHPLIHDEPAIPQRSAEENQIHRTK